MIVVAEFLSVPQTKNRRESLRLQREFSRVCARRAAVRLSGFSVTLSRAPLSGLVLAKRKTGAPVLAGKRRASSRVCPLPHVDLSISHTALMTAVVAASFE